MKNAVHWNIEVSKDTDSALRDFLSSAHVDAGGISKFVEEAVRWRILDCAVAEAKSRNQDMPAEELQAAIDEEVAEERKSRVRHAH